ncbi:MAG TPA: hypothetical protein VK137_19535, partial [Planctomycetaceae bacterium]|nr:hypothetical protein [Planctomycetaceae bacterium]
PTQPEFSAVPTNSAGPRPSFLFDASLFSLPTEAYVEIGTDSRFHVTSLVGAVFFSPDVTRFHKLATRSTLFHTSNLV